MRNTESYLGMTCVRIAMSLCNLSLFFFAQKSRRSCDILSMVFVESIISLIFFERLNNSRSSKTTCPAVIHLLADFVQFNVRLRCIHMKGEQTDRQNG